MSAEYNRGSLDASNGNDHAADDSPSGNGHANDPPLSPASPAVSNDPPAASPVADTPAPVVNGPTAPKETPKKVQDVMQSDIGITTLLNRLKQSIASARDFASFLQKRSKIEEEHATGLKRLAASHVDSLRKPEMRGGTFAAQVTELMRVHERMADNGMQFALTLHAMHEDLTTLCANMERGRKNAKHEGLEAEKRVSDAEAAMQKAKSKYDGLAEDYDRAKTGDTKGSRRIGLKGPKSQEQYEGDLQRKLQAADSDYEEKVRLAQAARQALIEQQRPRFVRQLRELCKECDAGLSLQLQKFASFNEKLLLGNGLVVSPLSGEESAQKSLRDVVMGIDNETDFHNYVGSHAGRIGRPIEIKYEKHPTLAPKTQQPRNVSTSGPTAPLPGEATRLNVVTPASQPGSTSSRYSTQPPPGSTQVPPSSLAYNQPAYESQPPRPEYGRQPIINREHSPYSPQQAPGRADAFNSPPYPTGPNESYVPPQQQTTGTVIPPAQTRSPYQASPAPHMPPTSMPPNSAGPISPAANNLPPLRPTFGVSLNDLFARDQTAVPLLVIQCILAIDHFGLETTGIYRQSGTASHVNRLINQFNHNPTSIDFRNPANFYHDVHIPATLLKQFFKQLPDPLFTRDSYNDFISAAKVEDEVQRRDGLHAVINELPDANYATLRALVLHLCRVVQNEGKNRMGSGNLAVCFA